MFFPYKLNLTIGYQFYYCTCKLHIFDAYEQNLHRAVIGESMDAEVLTKEQVKHSFECFQEVKR